MKRSWDQEVTVKQKGKEQRELRRPRRRQKEKPPLSQAQVKSNLKRKKLRTFIIMFVSGI